MIKLFLMLGLMAPIFASTFEPKSQSYSYQERPEFKTIMAEIKGHGDFQVKAPDIPESKMMSKGEQAVEEAKATQDGWKQEVADTLLQWKREQDIFLGRISVYKENTFEIPVKKEKIVEKKVPLERVPNMHIVNGTFAIPVRDQKNRPTCSAFAGIRAVEMILVQNGDDRDLSEQYFYWASKPNCQSSPCMEKGSWVTPGFHFSERQPGFDVPLESTCAYNSSTVDKNETQVPLSSECRQGSVKIMGYDEVKTLADLVEKLKKDVPVIMGAKLSENFYRNKGLVKVVENATGVKLDSHSKGHSFIAVGVIELPEKIRQDEGNYCIVVANSWGAGWGAGGYSCLTEKWLLKFRQPSPFIAVRKVLVRSFSSKRVKPVSPVNKSMNHFLI